MNLIELKVYLIRGLIDYSKLGIIATGKESVVLHAVSDKSKQTIEGDRTTSDVEDADTKEEGPQTSTNIGNKTHFAIKVYKTTLAGFKNRAEYVKNDFRFKNPRRVMKIWAEKEFLNLQRYI